MPPFTSTVSPIRVASLLGQFSHQCAQKQQARTQRHKDRKVRQENKRVGLCEPLRGAQGDLWRVSETLWASENNLSHPSHPSHLPRPDVIGLIPCIASVESRRARSRNYRTMTTEGNGHMASLGFQARGDGKVRKGVNLGRNKATILFGMSNLTKKWPENKAILSPSARLALTPLFSQP